MAKPRSAFGKLLGAKRKSVGLSQRRLAAKLHVSSSYLSAVERGARGALGREHWPALLRAIPALSLADLERAAALSGALEVDLGDARAEHVDLAIAVLDGVRRGDLPAADVEAMLGALRSASQSAVRAFGRVVDGGGAPVGGHAFVYRLSRSRGWVGLIGARSHLGRSAGPLDGHLAVVTDKRIDLLGSRDPRGAGFFDVPGGLAPGEYALDVHVNGDDASSAWAWPLAVTDGDEPQDVRIGWPKPQPTSP